VVAYRAAATTLSVTATVFDVDVDLDMATEHDMAHAPELAGVQELGRARSVG